MNPIEFKQQTGIAAEHQDEYRNLPMYRNETNIISCWKMTWKERVKVFFTGVVWLNLLQHQSQPITPSLLQVENPFEHHQPKN